jgi:hypothetical protein
MFSRARVYSLRSRFAATRRARLTTVWVSALAALFVCGCGDSPSSSSGNGASKVDPKAADAAADARCQQLMTSGLDMMKPENLGISAQEQQVVDALNNWAAECGKPVATAANDPLATKGSSAAFADLYDLADIEHVRNCWLVKQLGNNALHSQPTDLERAVALFDVSVRTVALLGSADPVFPQTPYDTMVLGRGTAEDRAWLFGELLRQAGIDSVIVRPKTGGPSAKPASTAEAISPRWLVGVLLDKQVYLFDPTLGWPIPSPDDKATSVTVRYPATLAQVAADDKLFRKLDVAPEKKYPLRAGDLKSVQVEIISSSRYSEPRIKRIEAFLAGNRSTTVYAPLADVGGRPGLRTRAEQGGAGLWKKEDVSVWEYPDRQITAAHHLDGQAKLRHDEDWLPFEGPVDMEFDMKKMQFKVSQGTTFTDVKGKGDRRQGASAMPNPGEEGPERVEVRHDARRQIKGRIAQLQGDYPTAIRKYLSVQLAELPLQMMLPDEVQERAKSLPPDKRPSGPLVQETPKHEWVMNFRAAEAAKFWMGVCQMDQHEVDLADETFTAYLRRYTQQGVGLWVMQAAYLRSLGLAESKRFALAVQAVTQLVDALPENDFRRPTFELLSERWRTVRDAAKPPASGTSAESPAQNRPAAVNSETAGSKTGGAGAKPATAGTAAPAAQSPPKAPAATPPASDAKSSAKPKSP